MDRLRIIFIIAACLLGFAHCIFGLMVFRAYTLELVWFLGAGVAMMLAAMVNFGESGWRLRISNLLILAYIALILSLAPQPQVWLGLLLFGGLTAFSFMQTE